MKKYKLFQTTSPWCISLSVQIIIAFILTSRKKNSWPYCQNPLCYRQQKKPLPLIIEPCGDWKSHCVVSIFTRL